MLIVACVARRVIQNKWINKYVTCILNSRNQCRPYILVRNAHPHSGEENKNMSNLCMRKHSTRKVIIRWQHICVCVCEFEYLSATWSQSHKSKINQSAVSRLITTLSNHTHLNEQYMRSIIGGKTKTLQHTKNKPHTHTHLIVACMSLGRGQNAPRILKKKADPSAWQFNWQ